MLTIGYLSSVSGRESIVFTQISRHTHPEIDLKFRMFPFFAGASPQFSTDGAIWLR